MVTAVATPLIERVDTIEAIVRGYAPDAERDRHLSQPVVDALLDARLFHMFVPRSLGGLEATLTDGLAAVERLAQFDSAAAWNLLQMAGSAWGSTVNLPDDGAQEIFASERAIVAGGTSPPGRAIATDGGYMLSGRWQFVSGCRHATWLWGLALAKTRESQPVSTEAGGPVLLMLVFPASEAAIIDTWNPLGMRGTGSHDVSADRVFVPHRRIAPYLRPDAPRGTAYQAPLYSLSFPLNALGTSAVALGIARAAIDEAVEIAKTKVPAALQPKPVDRSVVHMHLARAEATLQAARAYVYRTLDDAEQTVHTGETLTTAQRLHIQLAATHAVDASASAVDHVHACVGTTGIREEQGRLAQHYRDIHTITRHVNVSAARFESMGLVMLGLETDWVLFES